MACVHLVCGFLGVGKTTFSEELARRESAIRFSIDELYLRLFADGPTFDLDPRALERLLDVVNDLWPQLSQAGVAVVLDFGFWRKALRDEVRERARLVGAETHLHWLRCPDEVGVARCLARNGKAGAFLISEDGFWALRSRFEPPGPAESPHIVETG